MIEIVTHVWCPPGQDTYAELLRWQHSSLILNPPPVPVVYSICYCPDDLITTRVLSGLDKAQNLELNLVPGKPKQLFRRAILRNQRALATEADIVWFTDVDYLFGEGCLEDVVAQADRDSGLLTPEFVLICKSHAIGQDLIESSKEVQYPIPPPGLFKLKGFRVAVGGAQIVGANQLKKVGYLNHTRWVRPVDPKPGFRACRCDREFRKKIGGGIGKKIPIRNVYRMRHLQKGRDFSMDGDYIGPEAWT